MKDVLPFAPVAVGFRCCDATRTRFVDAGIEKLSACVPFEVTLVLLVVMSTRVVFLVLCTENNHPIYIRFPRPSSINLFVFRGIGLCFWTVVLTIGLPSGEKTFFLRACFN